MKRNLLLISILLSVILPAFAATPLIVDNSTQKMRDARRVEILTTELEKEQALFAQTRQELVHAMAANESNENITSLQALLLQHQTNIEALKKELASATGKPLHHSEAVKPLSDNNHPSPSWDVYARSKLKPQVAG